MFFTFLAKWTRTDFSWASSMETKDLCLPIFSRFVPAVGVRACMHAVGVHACCGRACVLWACVRAVGV